MFDILLQNETTKVSMSCTTRNEVYKRGSVMKWAHGEVENEVGP